MWKALELPKLSKQIKFEGDLGELESKKGFQRQSVTKYLGLTKFLREAAYCGKGLIAIFRDFFASVGGIFIWPGEVGTMLSFCQVYTLF